MNLTLNQIILLSVFFAVAVISLIGKIAVKKKIKALSKDDEVPKKLKVLDKVWLILSIFGSWFFVVEILGVVFGGGKTIGDFNVELFSPRIESISIFGYHPSVSVLISWGIIAVIFVLGALFRFIAVPRFTDKPRGIQALMEIAVEEIEKYIDSKAEKMGVNFGAYIFTVAVYMICCAFVELFGFRAPTSDITVTFAMALITFFLINAYGIARKGIVGRIKSMAKPTPIVFPIKIVTDIAVPVSLACRLFGNMLGGMIVMDLIYCAMGSASIGIPSLVGLYFNVFHPLIQAFIFVTLTLTFINEATETVE